jgi:ubiquinone biosynthesis protein
MSIRSLPWLTQRGALERSQQVASTLAQHELHWLTHELGLGSLARSPRPLRHLPPSAVQNQAEQLRLAFGELGVVFIKLGQFLSTRPDVLPPAYIAELSKLQDAAPPISIETIAQMVQSELGMRPEALFASFDPQPIAAASIGQVHAAMLKTGEQVVIKVQRPEVLEQVNQDLYILTSLAEWAKAHTQLGRDYNLPDLASEFAYTLRNELDYIHEAHNAERIGRNFTGDPTLRVPKVYWTYTTSRVLTLERLSGIKISDISAMDAVGIDRRMVARNAVNILLREVFEFGFFQADPHPGNFLVQPDGAIAMLDYGMVGYVDEPMLRTLFQLGSALATRDAAKLTETLFALGVAGRPADRGMLRRDVDHLLGRYAGQPLGEIAAAQVTNEIMSLALRYRLQLPGELMMLARLVVMSEAAGSALDPDFRMLRFVGERLHEVWSQRYSLATLGKRASASALDGIDLALDLPGRLSRMLSRAERGDIEFSINHEGLTEFAREIQRMANRVIAAILLSATIIALGLASLAYRPPGTEQFIAWVFGPALVLSIAVGAWLIWKAWRAAR